MGLSKPNHLVFVSCRIEAGFPRPECPTNLTANATDRSVECNVGIVAACLPCLKPLFKHILDSSLRYGSSSKKDTYKLRSHDPSEGAGGSQYLRSRSPHRAKGGRSVAKANPLDDNISEESILSQQEPHAITKTTVVTIERAGSNARYGTADSAWSDIGFKGQRVDDCV